jgi:hypothetical protein
MKYERRFDITFCFLWFVGKGVSSGRRRSGGEIVFIGSKPWADVALSCSGKIVLPLLYLCYYFARTLSDAVYVEELPSRYVWECIQFNLLIMSLHRLVALIIIFSLGTIGTAVTMLRLLKVTVAYKIYSLNAHNLRSVTSCCLPCCCHTSSSPSAPRVRLGWRSLHS